MAHFGKATPGRLKVNIECLAGCSQPMIGLNEMLAELRQDVGQASLDAMLTQGISQLFPDADTAALVNAQVAEALESDSPGPFPVLPLAAAGSAQAVLERPDQEVPAASAVTFKLDELLTKGCAPKRSQLEAIHPSLPMIQTGSRSDYTFSLF